MRNLLRVIHISILLISCGQYKEPPTAVFRMNMESALGSLDPVFARDQVRIWTCAQFFNGLVELDSNMEVAPSIASNWEILDNGKRYRFYLKDSVFFHEDLCFGEKRKRKAVAQDFVYSFRRLIDPAVASPGAWIFLDKVSGPEAFKAINDQVFEIQLEAQFPPFLGLLTMPYCYVVPKEAVEYYGEEWRAHPVGTGPFQLLFWEEGIKMVAKRNEHYFEAENGIQLPYLKGFEITFIENKQNALLEFIQGKLDFFNGIDGGFKDELLDGTGQLRTKYQDRFAVRVGPYLNTEYLGFLVDSSVKSETPNPLLDINFRKAISFSVNREEMIRYLRNGIGIPGNGGFIPIGLPGHLASSGYSFNVDSAQFYLALSNYKGEGLTIYTNKNYLDITLYVQRMWQDIGINVKVEVNPGPFHREMVSKSKFMCFRGSWLADYPDAENYLSLFTTPNKAPSGPNYTRYSNKQVDREFNQSMKLVADDQRFEKYRLIDSLIMSEAPVLILYYDQTVHLLSKRVARLPINAMNNLQLKTAQLHETLY